MINARKGRLTAWTVVTVLLSACGGGGGGSETTAGIDRTGTPTTPDTPSATISVGVIAGFGSVHVNGVHFETSSAEFSIDGETGSQEDLSIGDVVLVRGEIDSSDSTQGTATSVVFDDNVEGPIEPGSIDLVNQTLVVLGQTVRVTADTSFDDTIQPPALEALSDNDIVEVSGFVTSDGSIRATRIEPMVDGGIWEVTGPVSNHDDVARTFNINALVVDYSSVTMLQDFPAGAIGNGNPVEVKGAELGMADELVAISVEYKGDDISGNEDDHVEIEGFITRFDSDADFDVSGVAVVTDDSSVFEGGAAGDLALDIKIEVEGRLSAEGVIVADKIDIRRSNAFRVVALVDSVDAAAGSLAVLGITVTVDALTRIEDKSDLRVEPFSLTGLFADDYVEVRGFEFPAGTNQLAAGILERNDYEPGADKTELRGFVQEVNRPSLTILGVTVNTDTALFRDENENPIDADEFFTRLDAAENPLLVQAKGFENAGELDANEVEIELE